MVGDERRSENLMFICCKIFKSYVYLWQATVKKMLADIQARGEEGALDWAKKLDGEDDEDTECLIRSGGRKYSYDDSINQNIQAFSCSKRTTNKHHVSNCKCPSWGARSTLHRP